MRTNLIEHLRALLPGRRTARPSAALALLTLVVAAWCATSAHAQTPPAGTVIGNQASATYTDGSSIARTATSNTVQTVIQQVASFTLTASQTRTVAPGGTVYYP